MYQFRIRKEETKMIRYLDGKRDRNSYLLSLIRRDIDRRKILTIKKITETIKPILKEHGIEEVYLFGSYARGEADQQSDVDIYCEKGNIRTLIDQGKLEDELEKALKKKVDVIFTSSVNDEFFEEEIRKDLIKLC